MRRSWLRIVPLVLVLLPLVLPGYGQAQSRQWSRPVDISDAGTDTPYARAAWFPNLAADPDGTLHVTWYGGISRGDAETDFIDLLMYRSLRGGVWQPVQDVVYAGKGGFTVRNSIVAARDGQLHAMIRMGTAAYHVSAPWADTQSAQSWSEPVRIGDGAYYTALATDSRGALFAFWTGRESELYYRRSLDGGHTWSEQANLSNLPDGEDRPQVVVDAYDRVHLLWGHGFDWYGGLGKPESGVYRRSDDGGTTWSAPVIFALPGYAILQPSLAVSQEGNPLVVYRTVENDRMFFQRSLDGGNSWEPPGEIPGVSARDINDPPLDTYSLATDSLNRVHLLLPGFRKSVPQSDPELLHLIWDGSRWSEPQVVMSQPFLAPEWPQLIVERGTQLHAVWFTRNKLFAIDKSQADRQIWYSTLALDGPSQAPAAVFTVTPTSVATAAPTVASAATPTPTALPAVVRTAPPGSGSPAWERQGLAVVGLALIPFVGIMAVLLLILAWRRR